MGLFDLGFSKGKKNSLFTNPFEIGFHVPDSGWSFNSHFFDDLENTNDDHIDLWEEEQEHQRLYDMKYVLDEEEKAYLIKRNSED